MCTSAPDEHEFVTQRQFALVMSAEALTFLIASLLHVTVEWAPGAAGPEAIIGAVVAAGAVSMFAGVRSARVIALSTSGFAIAGTVLGLSIVLSGSGPRSVADVVYHVLILLALITSTVLLARARVRVPH